MKVCFVHQNQFAKMSHAIAINLKNRYGITDFCAYVISPGAADFIRSQKDIVYDPILVDHELHAQYTAETVDPAYLDSFEQRHAPPNLWHYLYGDRKLMMSIGPKEETTTVIDPLYSHEDLLKIFQTRAKAIEKMLSESKPDVILFFAIASLGHLLLFHVARKLGIQTLNLDFPRFGNSVCLSEDYRTITPVVRAFRESTFSDSQLSAARAAMQKYRETGSLSLEYFNTYTTVFQKRQPRLRRIFASLRYLVVLFGNYLRNRKLFTYGMTDINPLRHVWYKLRERYRALTMPQQLFNDPTLTAQYAYYPLHFEPELATIVLSPAYFDQVELVRHIARSLPLHWKLYVKEHPAMNSKRAASFYKELLKIPNVVLIKSTVKSFELIKNAQVITTITGTVGWEACLLGKPVITFGNVFYNELPFVVRAHDLDALPETITSLCKQYRYDEDAMVRFVAACQRESIPYNFSRLWYEQSVSALVENAEVQQFTDFFVKQWRKPVSKVQ